jgi:hypothetical protein
MLVRKSQCCNNFSSGILVPRNCRISRIPRLQAIYLNTAILKRLKEFSRSLRVRVETVVLFTELRLKKLTMKAKLLSLDNALQVSAIFQPFSRINKSSVLLMKSHDKFYNLFFSLLYHNICIYLTKHDNTVTRCQHKDYNISSLPSCTFTRVHEFFFVVVS